LLVHTLFTADIPAGLMRHQKTSRPSPRISTTPNI